MLLVLAVFAGTALADPPPGSLGECNKNLAGAHKFVRCKILEP
jgi:hypothetical protein